MKMKIISESKEGGTVGWVGERRVGSVRLGESRTRNVSVISPLSFLQYLVVTAYKRSNFHEFPLFLFRQTYRGRKQRCVSRINSAHMHIRQRCVSRINSINQSALIG